VLAVLSLIPTGFVFLKFTRPGKIYSDQQIYRRRATVAGGTLVPVVLTLWRWRGAGRCVLIVLGGFALRSLFIKIPHAS
jgi:hypothetical protein